MTDKPRVIRVERLDLFDVADYTSANPDDVVVHLSPTGSIKCHKIKVLRKLDLTLPLDPDLYVDSLLYFDHETAPHRDPFAYFANILNYPGASLVRSFTVDATDAGVRERHPWVNPFWTTVTFTFARDRSIECVSVLVKTPPGSPNHGRSFNYSLGNSAKLVEWTSNWFNWLTRPSVSALITWPENHSPPLIVEYMKSIHTDCIVERTPHAMILTDNNCAVVKSHLKSFWQDTVYKLAPPQYHFDTESKDATTGDFTGALLRDPFWRFRWQTYQPIIVDAAIALPDVPNYVLLEILDWLPNFWKWPQTRKVRTIESVRNSIRRLRPPPSEAPYQHINKR